MNKKQKTAELTRLMEMTPPSWLTKETYQEFLDNRDTWQREFSMAWSLNELLGQDAKDFTIDKGWNSADGATSPKFLLDKYLKGELISDPTTGQDPKTWSPDNVKTASKHAGNQWGYKKEIIQMGNDVMINTPSAWINFGTFNLIKLGGKIKLAREAKKLTQIDLASLMNKDQQTIQRIESGKTNPTYITLLSIANALSVEISDLLP